MSKKIKNDALNKELADDIERNILNKLALIILNINKLEEKNEDIIYLNFINEFALVPVVIIEHRDSYEINFIQESLLNETGLNKLEMINLARVNGEKLFPAKITTLNNELSDFFKDMNYDMKQDEIVNEISEMLSGDEECNIVCITNKMYKYGAGSIMYVGLLDYVSDKYFQGNNLILVPSSVHEMLAFDGNEDFELILNVVKDVNISIISDKDYLSNHIISYDRKTRSFKLI